MQDSMADAFAHVRALLPRDKTPEQKARRLALFQQFDKDAGGSLTLKETYNGLVTILHLNQNTTRLRDITQRAFNKAKSMGNKDRGAGDEELVEFLEFRLLLCYLYDYFELSALFEQGDTSGDRLLDEEELVALAPRLRAWGLPLSDPREVFRAIDDNGSGKVTFDEFVTWAVSAKMDQDGDPDVGAANPTASCIANSSTLPRADEVFSSAAATLDSPQTAKPETSAFAWPTGNVAAAVKSRGVLGAAPTVAAPATAPIAAPAATSSSTDSAGDVWRCEVCHKTKALQGSHLNGKSTVRSDCWPCGIKQVFVRGSCAATAETAAATETAQPESKPAPTAAESAPARSPTASLTAPDVPHEPTEEKLSDSPPTAAPLGVESSAIRAANSEDSFHLAAARAELSCQIIEQSEEHSRHTVQSEERTERFLLLKSEGDERLVVRLRTEVLSVLTAARQEAVAERDSLDKSLEERVKTTIDTTFDVAAVEAEKRALKQMRLDVRDELERNREIWLDDRDKMDRELVKAIHDQADADLSKFKHEVVQDVRFMLGAQALAALQGTDDALLLREQGRSLPEAPAPPTGAQRHLRSAFRKLS